MARPKHYRTIKGPKPEKMPTKTPGRVDRMKHPFTKPQPKSRVIHVTNN